MIILAVLAFVLVFLLFYDAIPTVYLAFICLAISAGIIVLRRRKEEEGDMLGSIDSSSRHSLLANINPGLKLLTTLGIIFAILYLNSPLTSFCAVILSGVIVVKWGETPLGVYIRLMSMPFIFILLSMPALLFDYSKEMTGIINISLWNGYLVLTENSQSYTLKIIVNAMGCVSCMYAFSLTTPLSDTVAILRKIKMPETVIELMILIYRYIFVLNKTLRELKIAAESRLGFMLYSRRIVSTGQIMQSLLASSFRKAMASFDAMESRCYNGKSVFLEEEKPFKASHFLYSAGLFMTVIAMFIIERAWI